MADILTEIDEKVSAVYQAVVLGYEGTLAQRIDRIESAIFSGSGAGIIMTSASIAEVLSSTNFVTGVSGWRINKTGNIEANNITARGTIYASAGSFTGGITIGTGGSLSSGQSAYNTGTGFWLEYNGGTPRFSLGIGGGAGMTWDGSALAISGTITATAGDILGTLYVGAAPNRIVIDGANKLIKSENYVAGNIGWQMTYAGVLDAQDVTIRGTLQSTVIAYNEVNAIAGQSYVVQRAGTMLADVTTATSPTTFNIDIKDPDSGHVQLFSASDILRITDAGVTNWVTVSSVSDQTTFWRYVCTKNNGSNTTFRAGTAVLSYGTSGDGYILMDAQAATGPHISVATHAGSPWSAITERVRIGNLNGWGAFVTDVFGFALGDYATSSYIYFDPATSNTKLVNGAGSVVIDKSGIVLTHGVGDVNKLSWVSGATYLSQLWTDFTSGTAVGNDWAAIDQGNTIAHNIKIYAKGKTGAYTSFLSLHSGETTTPSGAYIEATVRDASNVASLLRLNTNYIEFEKDSVSVFNISKVASRLLSYNGADIQTDWQTTVDAVNGGTIYISALKADTTTSARITLGTSANSIQFETGSQVFYLTNLGWKFGVTGQSVNEFSIDGTMAGNSDTAVPTEKAIVTYVTTVDKAKVSSLVASDGSPTGALAADASGYLSAGVQPLFFAINTVTDTNVTGDGTTYTVIFDSEIVDRNNNYNNSTGVFTAPVTGKYLLISYVLLQEVAAAHTLAVFQFSTSNRTYVTGYMNPGAIAGSGLIHISAIVIADMDASDVASVLAVVSGSTKVVDVYGNSTPHTFFMGYLLS